MRNASICCLWEKRKKYDLRFWIYFCVCVIGILLVNGMPVFASLGDFEVADLYLKITENTSEVNELLSKAFQFSSTSPYTIINNISAEMSAIPARAFISATKTVALAVGTLLLMVDFYKKTVNFEWSSKWENILLFLIKILIVKQIITNADVIMGYIYSGFNYITDRVTGFSADIQFLPCSIDKVYNLTIPYRGDKAIEWVYSQFWHEDLQYTYKISSQAVHIFYPNAILPADSISSHEQFQPPIDMPSFVPLIEYIIFVIPYFFVLKAVAIIVFVIAIGRVFELLIYTMVAPLPLATFASDVSHDVAKSFLKNYIATVLQIAIILVIFIIYGAVTSYFSAASNGLAGLRLIEVVELVALATCVVKSSSWARKVCGIG